MAIRAASGALTADVPAAGLPASEAAIAIEGLTRRFGERTALIDVSATLRRGETLAVFGPNGAGKTTLLRVLATLLLPHAGSVRVLDHELPRDAHLVRPRVGYLGHEPLLYRELTGRENLIFYARLYDSDRPSERTAELLDATNMTARADEPVRLLSRGMVQRLAVCRAVLHHPELLLLDEPWAGLDPDAEELVEPLIGAASAATRVLVTHDVERGLAESDRVLGLRDARLLLESRATDISPADVRALYAQKSA